MLKFYYNPLSPNARRVWLIARISEFVSIEAGYQEVIAIANESTTLYSNLQNWHHH
ncbi:hypothetical protein [Nostoc sp.]